MIAAMFRPRSITSTPCLRARSALVALLILAGGCFSDDEPEMKREILMQDECFPPPSPRLPNGETASAQEMREARSHVLDYIKQGQDYIDCVDFKASSAKDEDSKVSVEQYQRLRESMWKQMRRVEENFNKEVRAWRDREDRTGQVN